MILLMEVLVSGIYEALWENLNIFSISTGYVAGFLKHQVYDLRQLVWGFQTS